MEIAFEIEIKPQFQNSLKSIIDFIRSKSVQNSERFKKEIVELIYKISQYPESYAVQHKILTKHEYRYAIFKTSYHVYFRITGQTIMIMDIFHVKQNPLKIKTLDKN